MLNSNPKYLRCASENKRLVHRSGAKDKSTFVWPEGKRFAFTVVDDTDAATVENVGAVYDFL